MKAYHSKETIGEIFEMDIEELDYPTLEYESALIIQLAKMVETLDEAEKKNELYSVDENGAMLELYDVHQVRLTESSHIFMREKDKFRRRMKAIREYMKLMSKVKT